MVRNLLPIIIWLYVSQHIFPAAWCGSAMPITKHEFQKHTNKSIYPRFYPCMLIFHANTICYRPVSSFGGSCQSCDWLVAARRHEHSAYQYNWWESSPHRSDVYKRIPWISCNACLWHLGNECTWQSELSRLFLSHLQSLVSEWKGMIEDSTGHIMDHFWEMIW